MGITFNACCLGLLGNQNKVDTDFSIVSLGHETADGWTVWFNLLFGLCKTTNLICSKIQCQRTMIGWSKDKQPIVALDIKFVGFIVIQVI